MKKATFTLLLSLILILNLNAQPDEFGMRMHVINVGQAEAILLEFQKQVILIDAGVEIVENKDNSKDYRYRNNLRKYLKDFFDNRNYLSRTFYAVINSHPHPDHANYLYKEVFKKYKVLNFIESGEKVDDYGYIDADYLKEQSITHYKLFELELLQNDILLKWKEEIKEKSGVEVRFLDGYRNCNDENNFSLVMRVSFGQKSFLLTGDAEIDDKVFNNTTPERCTGLIPYLISKYKNDLSIFKADVYKVGHHGAENGTSDEFLNLITPSYSVISAGDYRANQNGSFSAWQHGHPREKTISKLEKATTTFRPAFIDAFTMIGQHKPKINRTIKKSVYCTCWDDNIIFTVNKEGTNISVETKKSS